MSLQINQNAAAINAHRNLVGNDAMLGKSLERLSSGFRINRAADDAAGLVKSETLRSGTNTKFAGLDVFDAATRTFQVGANSGETIDVTVGALSATSIGSSRRSTTFG